MSTHGIIIINILALSLIVLIFNLVRTRKLHVSYAVVWLISIAGLMVVTWFPPLLYLIPRLVGAIFPASALSLFAFVFIILVLILFSVQLSTLSARQTEIIQSIALNNLLSQEGPRSNASGNDESGIASPAVKTDDR